VGQRKHYNSKSFLVLFFKKELLPCLLVLQRTAADEMHPPRVSSDGHGVSEGYRRARCRSRLKPQPIAAPTTTHRTG
jgi:hypothetical protein